MNTVAIKETFIVVGVGEMAVSCTPGEALKTFALGSCVAVIMLSPQRQTVGLLHVALPEAQTDLKLATEKPGYFADTGIPILLQVMACAGCCQSGIVVKLIGGASIMDPNRKFDIGRRNLLAVKKNLWRYRLGAVAEDVGGNYGRTVSVSVDTGIVRVSSPGRGEWDL